MKVLRAPRLVPALLSCVLIIAVAFFAVIGVNAWQEYKTTIHSAAKRTQLAADMLHGQIRNTIGISDLDLDSMVSPVRRDLERGDHHGPGGRGNMAGSALGSEQSPNLDSEIMNSYMDLHRNSDRKSMKTGPESFEKLEAGLAAGDCPAVLMAAHTLKSSSANLGAAGLSELCRQLEAAAQDGDLETGPAMLANIRSEYALVAASLAADDGRDTATN